MFGGDGNFHGHLFRNFTRDPFFENVFGLFGGCFHTASGGKLELGGTPDGLDAAGEALIGGAGASGDGGAEDHPGDGGGDEDGGDG